MIIYDRANDKMIEVVPKSYGLLKQFNRIQDDMLVFRHSHIAITNYTMGDNREFEKALSVWNESYFRYDRVAGHYVKELREFRVPRSFDTAILQQYFPKHKPIVDNEAYPADKIDVKLLAPPRDDEQRVGLAFLCSQGDYTRNFRYTTLMLDMVAGSGKAQPDDTLIPTPRGMKRLNELKVGDKVFNLQGEPVDVLKIFPRGMQDTYEVTFSDGRKTRCNLDHLWYVSDSTSHHKARRVLTLRNMLHTYILPWLYKNQKVYRYAVDLPGPIQYTQQRVPIDPYTLGMMLGDECLNKQHPTTNSESIPFSDEMVKFIKDESGDKFIPDIYKYNAISIRKRLLQGLMDTSGHVDAEKCRLSYTTISTRLKDDVVELVRSLGYSIYVTVDCRHDEYKPVNCYTIRITCSDSNIDDFFHNNPKPVICDQLTIVDIRKVEPTYQRCIYIDDPLHVYITENYIPTHNTWTTIAATCFLQARTVVIVPFTNLVKQWKKAFLEYTTINEDEILAISSTDIKTGSQEKCLEIMHGEHSDKKVFIFMVDTLVAFQKTYGNLAMIDMLRMTNAYTKIMDEIHLEMKALSMIDALSNFRMNYYASATPDRSQSKEKWIFRTIYRNCPRFGQNFKTAEEKWTNIIVARYAFIPTTEQIKRMVNPRKKWLTPKAYEKELISAPDTQLESFHSAFRNVMRWSKQQLKPGNKILILCSTIDGTGFMQTWAEEFFPGQTARYYATMRPKDRAEALEQTVICATSQSLGTGADISGIQHVYNIETYATSINAGQLPGRARKIKGVSVFYIEFVNFSYGKTYKQFEKHKPYLIKASKTGKLMVLE